MKIVIPGGTGQVEKLLSRVLLGRGHDVTVPSRKEEGESHVILWDGRTVVGPWAEAIEGADAVNRRYSETNLPAREKWPCAPPW